VAKGDDIRERLVEFAVQVMDLCDELPKTRLRGTIFQGSFCGQRRLLHRITRRHAGRRAHETFCTSSALR